MEKKKNIALIVATIMTSIANICALVYLIITLLYTKDNINHTFLVINSILLFLFTTCLEITILIKKGKVRNIVFSITSFLISIFIIFNIITTLNIIKLPTLDTLQSFYNTNINDALIWGEKNKIKINQTYEYSDTIKEFNIISQDVAAGTLLKEVTEINLLVSSGPNPDKLFVLQSLIGMNIDDALAIINSNYMKNVEINYEINETYDKDTVIDQNINGEIKRSDNLVLTVSLGKEEDLQPVEIIDFKGKTLFEATLWLKRNGFTYELSYEFDNNYNKDICIGQSEQVGTTIDPKETKITLIISKGKEITIPDFTIMTVTEATNWITDNKLKVTFKEAYDNELPEGTIIASSFAINTAAEEGDTIELTISKGKLKMEKFDNINAFRAWAESLGLAYEENSAFSDLDIGSIVETTPNVGENINLNDKIYVTYSKGKSTTIPNFYNKSKSEADTLCSNYSLKCYYSYRYSDSVSSGYILNQSMSSGSEVAQNTSITLYISSGPEPVKPTNTPTPTPIVCSSTATYQLFMQQSWIVPGSASSTIATLKQKLAEKYPNITFVFQTKASNDAAGLIHDDSPIKLGSTIQDCQTYTIIINE